MAKMFSPDHIDVGDGHGLCWLHSNRYNVEIWQPIWDVGHKEDFVTNITVTVRSDENRLQEFHYEDKPPKLYLLEECKLKCAEYDGLPSAFHKYKQGISKRDMKNFKRDDDRSSNANLFFVDSHYDFSRAEWYSGGSIFIISWYKTRIQASKEFLIGFGIKTIHTQNTIFQFWTID